MWEVNAGQRVRTKVLIARQGKVLVAIMIRVGGDVLLSLMTLRSPAASAAEELLEDVGLCEGREESQRDQHELAGYRAATHDCRVLLKRNGSGGQVDVCSDEVDA